MKGTQGKALDIMALKALANTFAHFPGGFIGESNGCYFVWGKPHIADQIGNFFNNNPSLATTSTGQHQQ